MILQGDKIWLCGQFVPAQLKIEQGVIQQVMPKDTFPADTDYGNRRVVPGFLDIHTHGAYGFDTNDAQPEGLRSWLKKIPQEGVTALCPTTITQSEPVLSAALANVAQVMDEGYEGAEILGVHLEGPFLSPAYKGAQPEQHIVPPQVAQFQAYQQAARGGIRLITLAPEEDAGYALTRYCAENGVAVSMGHSGATYTQALLGAANGARSMTHVFNGMSPMNHREPGLAGAALRLGDLYGEIICDCVHVAPPVLNAYFAAKGRDRAVMVTDSLQAKGCPRATYLFGGNEITIGEDGTAYLKTGTIAGSTLRMNQGLRNLVETVLIPFDSALQACTLNPARLLGVDNRKGRLAAGCDADLAVLGDDYSVLATYCRGRLAYKGE